MTTTTTTCKTCKYKGTTALDPSDLKNIKYACYASPPVASVLLVPKGHVVEMATVSAYPQVSNDTPSCRYYEGLKQHLVPA